MKEMGWVGFDWSSLQKGFWWQGKVERRSWDRGGMGARLWEVSEVVKVKVKVSGRHGWPFMREEDCRGG